MKRNRLWVLIVVCLLSIGVFGTEGGSASASKEIIYSNRLLDSTDDDQIEDEVFNIPVILNQENHTVPNVKQAFDGLTHHGEWLAFHRNGAQWTHTICINQDALDAASGVLNSIRDWLFDLLDPGIGLDFDWLKAELGPIFQAVMLPSSCYPIGEYDNTGKQHYQGITRSPRIGGKPILYVTRAGNPDSIRNPTDGAILVVEMASRNRVGERLRSNRLQHYAETQDTSPPTSDRVIKQIRLDHGFLDYRHPGGMQMIGDILAVAMEEPNTSDEVPQCWEERTDDDPENCLTKGKIAFFDSSDPANPVHLESKDLEFGHKAAAVGMAKLDDSFVLAVVSGSTDEEIEFWQSNGPRFEAEDFKFTLISEVHWDTKPEPQSLNFVQEEETGDLYLIGAHNTDEYAPFRNGTDKLWLWKVNVGRDADGLVDSFAIDLMDSGDGLTQPNPSRQHLASQGEITFVKWWRWAFDRQESNFLAGAGAYVSPTGELLYYGTTFYNEGPDNTARIAEMRHAKVSYDDTCGAKERLNHLGGPYRIPEGSKLELYGGLTYVQPWVQMYADKEYQKASVMMDWEDQELDDYSFFNLLDGWKDIEFFDADIAKDDCNQDGFHDCMSAFRFCGPPGSTLEIMGDEAGDGSPGTPTNPNWDEARDSGAGYIVCEGDGTVMETSNVKYLPAGCRHEGSGGADSFGNEADSALITWTPPNLTYSWNLQGEGELYWTYDGTLAVYLADSGSSQNIVRVSVLDEVYTTEIEVVNIPPFIEVPEIPTMKEGEYFELEFNWWDPGVSEVEFTVDWGDMGVVEQFVSEADSYDDGYYQGNVLLNHVYADDGRYILRICAFDGEEEYCRIPYIPVENVLPKIIIGDDQMIYEGDLLTPIAFNDKGTLDTHTAEIDWGDGLGFELAPVIEEPDGPPGSVDGADGKIAPNQHILPPGVYTATVCLRDDDMEDEEPDVCESLTVTVVNGFMRFCAYADDEHHGVTMHEETLAACGVVPTGVLGEMRAGGVGSRGDVDINGQTAVEAILLSLGGKINIGQDVTVFGTVTAGDDVTAVKGSKINGSITSGHRVKIKQDATVNGDITAADRITVDRRATVNGATSAYTPVPPIPAINWVDFAVEAGTENVTLRKGAVWTLEAGVYRDLKVGSGATLTLQAGQYAFRRITVEKGATLLFDLSAESGTAVIDVADKLLMKQDVRMEIMLDDGGQPSGEATDILFRVANTAHGSDGNGDDAASVQLHGGGTYLGTFLAPHSNVQLGDGARLEGALYGRKVKVEQGATIIGRPALDLFVDLFVK